MKRLAQRLQDAFSREMGTRVPSRDGRPGGVQSGECVVVYLVGADGSADRDGDVVGLSGRRAGGRFSVGRNRNLTRNLLAASRELRPPGVVRRIFPSASSAQSAGVFVLSYGVAGAPPSKHDDDCVPIGVICVICGRLRFAASREFRPPDIVRTATDFELPTAHAPCKFQPRLQR